MVECYICEKPFTPGRRDFQHATGWVQPHRKQGGANALARSQRFDRWAHYDCVKFPGQGKLI